jgi:protein-tyrosine-phosphatase
MAVGVMKKLLPAKIRSFFRISSAGIYAVDGLRASPYAIEVCRDDQIDISAHRSKRLTEEMVRGSDLLLTMELVHKHYIINSLHGTSKKVYCLREYLKDSSEDMQLSIPDPVGSTREVYRKVFYEIKYELLRTVPFFKEHYSRLGQ